MVFVFASGESGASMAHGIFVFLQLLLPIIA